MPRWACRDEEFVSRQLCAVDPDGDAHEVSELGARGRWHHEMAFGVWLWGIVRLLAGPAIVVLAMYCLFKYVITDEGLVLDYLRALAWPLVIVGVVYWFRVPLANRLESLESVDSPWWNARFAKKAAKRLRDEIGQDLSSFSTVRDEGAGPIPADGEDESDSDDFGVATDRAPVGEPDTDDGTANLPHSASGSSDVEGGKDGIVSGAVLVEEQGPDDKTTNLPDSVGDAGLAVLPTDPLSTTARINQIRAAEIRNVATGLELGRADYFRATRGAEEDPDSAAKRLTMLVRRRLHELDRRNRMYRDQARASRASVESVIQKSAEWGYDMGRAGAPRAVPDIEWNPDGTWKITTEVPPRRPSRDSTSRTKQILSLQDEIKKLDRRQHVGPGISLLSPSEEEWLRELKRKLAVADPGNPWAL